MSKNESDTAVMDLYVKPGKASDVAMAQTALAHVDLPARSAKASVSRIIRAKAVAGKVACSVMLEEASVTGILVLRATSASGSLASALQSEWQLDLPGRLESHSTGEDYCIRWMSPDEWLLTCPLQETFAIERKLRDAVDGHIAIVNVSGGYSILNLSGDSAAEVLKKSTAYDIHADNFPPGKVVNTVMAKAQVTLRARQEGGYEIVVRRSFADYLWLWLQRAGREFGLEAYSGTAD